MEHSYLFLGICASVVGLWNLIIAILGLFPKCRSTVIGTLNNTKTKNNVKARWGTRIPAVTDYAYSYCVKRKVYKYSGQALRTKRHLLPKTSMVFVKWFPRHAYPNRFTGEKEWVTAFIMLLIGMSAIFAGILA